MLAKIKTYASVVILLMPKKRPVIIDFYATGGMGPAPQCHVERGTSEFSLTLHLQRGQVAHLRATQNDQTTTMLQCWLHHRGKAVAHDLKPRGTVSCEYTVV